MVLMSEQDLYHFSHMGAFCEKCKTRRFRGFIQSQNGVLCGFNTEIFGEIHDQTYFPVSSMTQKNTARDSVIT